MIIFYLGIKEKAVLHQEIKYKYSIKNHMKKDSIFKFYFDYKIELLINIINTIFIFFEFTHLKYKTILIIIQILWSIFY